MTRRFLLLITVFLSFVLFQPVAAKGPGAGFVPGTHISFEHLTIDDGLSQNAGLAMLQDSRGYLWFGTQDGLNRFDGYSIKQYRNDPEDSASIIYNSIIALYEDREGFIWVGTWGEGISRYDPSTDQFVNYAPNPDDAGSLSNGIVTAFYQDDSGNLWVGTFAGLERLDLTTNQFTHYRNDPFDSKTLSSDIISVIAPAEDGKLWVGTGAFSNEGQGLNLFDPATGIVQRKQTRGSCFAGSNIADIVASPYGKLWIAYGGYGVTGGGLDEFDPKTDSCVHRNNLNTFDGLVPDDNITDLTFDSDGALWATSLSGGVWYRTPGGKFIGIHHDPSDPESLSNESVFSVISDRSDVIWIGTLSGGINKLVLDTFQFHTYRNYPNDPASLPSNHVSSFAQTSDGAIWVGTFEKGFALFDQNTGRFTSFTSEPGNLNSLSNDVIMSILPDDDDSLWIGTLGGGLEHYLPYTGTFVHYQQDPANPSSLLDNQVTALTRDQQDRLWVASFVGLSRLDRGERQFVNYTLPAPPTCFLVVDETLWMGSWGGGIYQLDLSNPANLNPDTVEFINLVNNPEETNSLSHNGVWNLVQTEDGMIWIATEGGLNRYDPVSGEFKAYTTREGLSNNTVLAILPDQLGYLWLTTNNGLNRFDPRNETFTVFEKSDGLQANEFNSGSAFQARNGDIFVGGVNGLSVFDPTQITTNSTPPQVAITNFSIFNEPQKVDLSGNTPIKLVHEQNFISFDFVAFDYQSPENNQYAYQLEGFDKGWVDSGTRNYASYTNLPGGSYTFKVRAANSDGVWNETGAAIKLVVTPPFWETWQFRIGLAVGVALLIALVIQLRVLSVKKKNQQLQKMLDEQLRIEAELRVSEARFKALFENSAIGVGMMTTEPKILDMNPAMCRMLGYTRDELIGQSPKIAIYSEDLDSLSNHFVDLISGKTNFYVAERRYVRKNGEIFWIQISNTVVRDQEGNPLYVVGIVIDIDAEKRAAEKLAAQEAANLKLLEQKINERTIELNQANELLREKATQDAVIAERTRLARDLHDAVTQTLFSTTLIADVLPDIWEMNQDEGKKRLEEIRQLTRGALAEMRTLLVELRPNALVEVPLPTLLRQLTEALAGRSRMTIQLDTQGERKLPPDVQVGLYRLAQEALNNVVKHARATHAVVTLRLDEPVRLTITDNGQGFDPSTVTADHLGLKIMRERTEAIGATLKLFSEPSEGTQISIIWHS